MIKNSFHEWLPDEDIVSWILDLSQSSDAILDISSELLKEVIWQDNAKKILRDILEEITSGVNLRKAGYNKPIASMIFAWPSWVGKTLLARVTQKILNKHFSNEIEIIKINCADFAGESIYGITRLTWASAGFIWSDRKPVLHPDNVEWKGRVILLDEIEKAWPAFWNILLSILDDGTLDIDYTETNKEKAEPLILDWKAVDSTDISSLRTLFWDSVIIMTSNIWNDAVEKELQGLAIGFWSWEKDPEDVDIESIILQEFWKQFRIEMQWRFDYVVHLEHLTKDNARDIINQLINRLSTNTLSKWNGFVIEFTNEAKEKILDEITNSPSFRKFGWRYIEWYFKKNVIPYVAKAINSWKFREDENHSCLLVTLHNGEIVFSKIPIWESKEVKIKVEKTLGRRNDSTI